MKMIKVLIFVFLLLILIIPISSCGKEDIHKAHKAKQVERKRIDYWTCAMHPSVRSEKPGKCPICGMDLTPVYKEEKTEVPQEGIYYGCGIEEEGHCPHCDEGKEDARCICGEHSFIVKDLKMNCPVCGRTLRPLTKEEIDKIKQREERDIISRVKLSKRQVELAGIKTESVTKRHLIKEIRTVGRIAYDPELVITQEEFLTALENLERLSSSSPQDVKERAEGLLEKSNFKLRLLGMSDELIEELKNTRKKQTNLILPEETVWVYAEVYEYELSWVKKGAEIRVSTTAFPGEEFKGAIRSIDPVLNPQTRSVRIRAELQNPGLKLKPEMFVDVVIESMYVTSDGSHEVLAVPKEAILDTGIRKIVYVDTGDGRFLGKEIEVGPEATSIVEEKPIKFYPVLKGLSEGEIVVTKGNFLIDSQSQLTGGMSVLWGGAQEIKTEPTGEESEKPQTQHKH